MNYTNENIEKNPSIVSQMSMEDICVWKEQNLRKRLPIRPLIEQRIVDIKQQQIYAGRMNRVYEHVECIWFMIQGMLSHHDPKNRLRLFGRLIGNAIHDMPHMWTGLESVESLDARKNKTGYVPTDEHFYPRQFAGEFIISEAIRDSENFTTKKLAELLFKFCRVHKVTREENRRLERHQKADTFTCPKLSYTQAEIVLEKVRDTEDSYEKIFTEIIELLY